MYVGRVRTLQSLASRSFPEPSCLGSSKNMPLLVNVHDGHHPRLSFLAIRSCSLLVRDTGFLNVSDWSSHQWAELVLEAKQLSSKTLGCRSRERGVETGLLFKHRSNLKRKAKLCKEKLIKCQAFKQSRLDAISYRTTLHSQDGLCKSTDVPSGGDLVEVETFCRIHRLAEELHTVVMTALCNITAIEQSEFQASEGGNLFSDGKEFVKDTQEMEEKVVASLACIGATLQEGRSDLFANWTESSVSVENLQLSYEDNKLPRLAGFRVKMRNCCKLLQVGLGLLFPPYASNNLVIHQSLQRLVNACLDVGFIRPKGTPSHEDIPNLATVSWQSQVGKEDGDVAFWKGGQITEEGLQWLIDNGFRMLVDLRAEEAENRLAGMALKNAVDLGKIKYARIPVSPETAPSMEQVEDFARFVADPENQPLFLQSRGGLGRTCAMVSRWREIIARKDFKVNQKPSAHITEERLCVTEGYFSDNDSVDESTSDFNKDVDPNGTRLEGESSRNKVQDDKFTTSSFGFGKHYTELDLHAGVLKGCFATSPFEAQRPRPDVLMKKGLTTSIEKENVVPNYFEDLRLKNQKHGHTSEIPPARLAVVNHTAVNRGFEAPEYDSTQLLQAPMNSEQNSADTCKDDGTAKLLQGGGSDCSQQHIPSREDDQNESLGAGYQPKVAEAFGDDQNHKRTGGIADVYDEEPPSSDGNMCASKTGVVRLQSRRKAEMYLVRTDGVSCAREMVEDSTLAFTHPSTQQQMLMWKTPPRTVLVLKKLGDELMGEAEQVASFLHYEEQMNVMVEPEVHDQLARRPEFGFIQTFYNQNSSKLHESVDFVVCLGGDGVILHASNLFRTAVPPIVSFNLGSLGFLTAHPFEDFKQDLRAIIHGNTRSEGVYLTLRMRLLCELLRGGHSIQGKVFEALNEVVVDRGSNPYLSKIECYERNRLITKVQADGVIVATPTGSTAYSTAAGGSMVHPNVPCILFTPICPHSLSFRPVIFPDSAVLELKVPEDARSNAWVSFDGKKRQQLFRGDSVRVRMSRHPLPTVNKSDQTDDWFRSLIRCLNWNGRLEQKELSR